MVLRKKHNVQEVVVMGIQNLTKRIADSANVTRKGIQRAITRSFFSPSPTFSDVSYNARSSGIADNSTFDSTFTSAKEDKIIVEQQLLCIDQQIEYQKYVIMSEFYDQEETKTSEAELN